MASIRVVKVRTMSGIKTLRPGECPVGIVHTRGFLDVSAAGRSQDLVEKD